MSAKRILCIICTAEYRSNICLFKNTGTCVVQPFLEYNHAHGFRAECNKDKVACAIEKETVDFKTDYFGPSWVK